MALARIPLPSFTFVLTSGPQSFHRYPTAIKLDSSSSPAMLSTTRDHLMQTIHLRDELDDSIENSLSAVDNKQGAGITKRYVLMVLHSLRRKLFSAQDTIPVRRITN